MSSSSILSSIKSVQATGQVLRAKMMFSNFHVVGTNGQINFNHSFCTLDGLINLHAISDQGRECFDLPYTE